MGGFPASDSVQFNKPRGSSTEEAPHSLQTRCYVTGFINTNPREPQAALRGRRHYCPHYRDVDAEAQKVEALTKGNRTQRREWKRCQASRRLQGRPETGHGTPRGPRLLPGSDPSAPESLGCCCSPLSLQGGYRRSVPPGGGGKSSHAAGSNGVSVIPDGKTHFSAA